MPVYDYRCSNGHHYERTEGFSAPAEHACQVCGKTARRQISLPAVIFKGSGFYSTDNRKSSPSNGRSPTRSDSPSSDTATDGDGGHSDGGSKVETAPAD